MSRVRIVPTLGLSADDHVLTSQVETESKPTGPRRETLQQHTASNSHLLVVIADDFGPAS